MDILGFTYLFAMDHAIMPIWQIPQWHISTYLSFEAKKTIHPDILRVITGRL